MALICFYMIMFHPFDVSAEAIITKRQNESTIERNQQGGLYGTGTPQPVNIVNAIAELKGYGLH